MEHKGIKNIIFDLGGVIINLDPGLTHKAFAELGAMGFDDMFTFTHQLEVISEFEIGRITAAELRSKLAEHTRKEVADEDFDRAWNAMLLDIPPHRLDLLKELKKNYNLYLLSNSNELHIASIDQYLAAEHGIEKFDDLFHKSYYSHLLGMRKPNEEIYRHVLEESGLNPHETLFFDDNASNVQAAEELGIKAIRVERDIVTYFTKN